MTRSSPSGTSTAARARTKCTTPSSRQNRKRDCRTGSVGPETGSVGPETGSVGPETGSVGPETGSRGPQTLLNAGSDVRIGIQWQNSTFVSRMYNNAQSPKHKVVGCDSWLRTLATHSQPEPQVRTTEDGPRLGLTAEAILESVGESKLRWNVALRLGKSASKKRFPHELCATPKMYRKCNDLSEIEEASREKQICHNHTISHTPKVNLISL